MLASDHARAAQSLGKYAAPSMPCSQAGEIIGYPTDTVYGLGCDLFNKKAVDRLYQVKRMPTSHNLGVHLP